jgi:hypothetical protein
MRQSRKIMTVVRSWRECYTVHINTVREAMLEPHDIPDLVDSDSNSDSDSDSDSEVARVDA